MNINVAKSIVVDSDHGISSIFEFNPFDGDEKAVLDRRVDGSDSFIGALNIPVIDGKMVVVRKDGSPWNAPVIEPSSVLSIRDSIDTGMKQKINATGETKIVGWLDMSYEFQGNHTSFGKVVVTVFKVEEMGEFLSSPSCDERSLATLESLSKEFEDSPIDYGDENIFMHIFEIAVNI